MKDDRHLIELSKSSLTLEVIAGRLNRSPDKILRSAIRLGLSLKREGSPDRGLKAKGK
jgi:hypothetical protein